MHGKRMVCSIAQRANKGQKADAKSTAHKSEEAARSIAIIFDLWRD